MNWILHPAVPYGLSSVGLLLCAYLFLSTKREVRRAALAWRRKQRALEDRIDTLQAALTQAQGEVGEIKERSTILVEPPPTASGLNIHKRIQALRMYHRGEPAGHIAAALVMPLQEVELLVKVEKLSAARPAVG